MQTPQIKYCAFYPSFYELTQNFTINDRDAFHNAIFRYAFFGEEPDFLDAQKHLNLYFIVVKPNIESSRTSSINGKKGGLTNEKSDLTPLGRGVGSKKEKEKEIEKEKEKEIEKEIERIYSEDFLRFWKMYPRQQNKEEAFDAWEQMRPNLMNCLDSIHKTKQTGVWDDVKFVPFPAKWLREKKWTDNL